MRCGRGHEAFDERWVLRLGFLYAGYEDEYVFWEAMVLARKAILSAAAVLLSHSGTTVQVVVAVLILVLSLFIQLKHQPFEHDWHDLMEERSLLASLLVLIVCLFGDASSQSSGLSTAATVLVSITTFLITILYFWSSLRMLVVHATDRDEVSPRLSRVMPCLRSCCCASAKQDVDRESRQMVLTARGRRSTRAERAEVEMRSSLGHVDWTMNVSSRESQRSSMWERRFDEAANQEYFENSWTGRRHGICQKVMGALKDLSEGWQRHFSIDHGMHYYSNPVTGEAVWEES